MDARKSAREPSESIDVNHRARCENCGNALRRLARQGFLQKKLYSRFGYYPWECPLCRELVMVRQQHRLKRRIEAEDGAMEPVSAGAAGQEAT
jgi:DNA-directed RNA polymerase subunit RPC12/RpoP